MQEPRKIRPRTMGMKMGIAAGLIALAGTASAYTGTLPPFGGFIFYALGILIALAGTFMGVVALVRGRGSVAAVLVPVAVLAALFAPGVASREFPMINDITTNIDNPPVFVAAKQHAPNENRDMAYADGDFATQTREAYPDLVTRRVATDVKETMEILRTAIADLPDSNLVAFEPGEGRIEATQTSGIFKFVDDFVVRVTADGTGSSVDIRSKSRDGKGDWGVNARRIRTLLAALGS